MKIEKFINLSLSRIGIWFKINLGLNESANCKVRADSYPRSLRIPTSNNINNNYGNEPNSF